MNRSILRLVTAAATLMVLALPPAFAKSKNVVAGDFSCGCKGGTGTCTFKSSSDHMSCFKGVEDTCTASCSLTTSPDPSPANNAATGTKSQAPAKAKAHKGN